MIEAFIERYQREQVYYLPLCNVNRSPQKEKCKKNLTCNHVNDNLLVGRQGSHLHTRLAFRERELAEPGWSLAVGGEICIGSVCLSGTSKSNMVARKLDLSSETKLAFAWCDSAYSFCRLQLDYGAVFK